MKRVVVIGGSGFFGGLIAERLAAAGLQPIIASRSRGELRIDANNPEDLRNNLKGRDLVIDAAGPFQKRTPALIEAARTIGFDVIAVPVHSIAAMRRRRPSSLGPTSWARGRLLPYKPTRISKRWPALSHQSQSVVE